MPIIFPVLAPTEPAPEPPKAPEPEKDPFKVLEASQRILFFFAHPDDETILAPEILKLCISRQCRAVYATRGGQPTDCWRDLCKTRDVQDVRSDELDQAAAYFRLEPVKWNWPVTQIGMSEEQARVMWHGREADIQIAVSSFAPDAILTFSHEHGVTSNGHPGGEHVYVSEMVQRALKDRFDFNRIVVMESNLTIGEGSIGFTPIDNDPWIYTRWAGEEWQHVLWSMRTHASQFNDEWLELATQAPENKRAMSLSVLGNR